MFICEFLSMQKQIETTFKAKEKYFIRNGANLLEKQVFVCQGKDIGASVKTYASKDISRATNNYDPELIIGRNVATVFKAVLDDRAVAIKAPHGLPATDVVIDFFLNQVAITQVLDHKHVVRLYGCCLETEIPILVFELIPNGSLYDHLYCRGKTNPVWISWPDRVRIAAEISHALCYMHCGLSKPIIHLNVKSSSIFLDNNFTAKLSNFGYSVPITPGEDQKTWDVFGTSGYVDPEYQETLLINENCDVYSFGVVLLELLTNHNPQAMYSRGVNLVDSFVNAVAGNQLLHIVHDQILKEGNAEDFRAFAALALKCVGEGNERPTMQQVSIELSRIYHCLRL